MGSVAGDDLPEAVVSTSGTPFDRPAHRAGLETDGDDWLMCVTRPRSEGGDPLWQSASVTPIVVTPSARNERPTLRNGHQHSCRERSVERSQDGRRSWRRSGPPWLAAL